MPVATGNRLLPVLAAGVVLMLVVVLLKSCGGEADSPVVLDAVPQAPSPDADSPADTITTLTANVAAMTAEVEALRDDNARMREENSQLLADRNNLEDSITSRLQQALRSRMQSADRPGDPQGLSSLTARVDALAESLSRMETRSNPNDIPIGLGFDGLDAPVAIPGSIVWIEPLDGLDAAKLHESYTGLLNSKLSGQGNRRDDGWLQPLTPESGVRENSLFQSSQPVYTVPRNATLIGATAMTALVGRIPVQGQVRDPMPFKVITGADNLAANGLTLPGVAGMVWSGTAIGDWTLSCVTGRLDSVTFVFDDGTIRTISGDDRKQQPGGGTDKPLAWISDTQGVPCINGERKTNAPAFLGQRIGVMALQAAAGAAAAAETTSVVSESGAATSQVTGDPGAYMLGKAVSGGSEEISRWLMERQAQSFDAVFVPAGVDIAIHVDRELPIDFDPNGRRLIHASHLESTYRTRLD